VAEQIVHPAARLGAELEVAAVGVAVKNGCAFEGSADAVGQALEQRLQLRHARRRNTAKYRRMSTDDVRPVEHEHVKGER
jgi:hypothetical protein